MPIQEVDPLPNWLVEQIRDVANGCAGSEGAVSLSPVHAQGVARMIEELGGNPPQPIRFARIGGVHQIIAKDLQFIVNSLYGAEVVVTPQFNVVDATALLSGLATAQPNNDLRPFVSTDAAVARSTFVPPTPGLIPPTSRGLPAEQEAFVPPTPGTLPTAPTGTFVPPTPGVLTDPPPDTETLPTGDEELEPEPLVNTESSVGPTPPAKPTPPRPATRPTPPRR